MKPGDKISVEVDFHGTRLEGFLVTLETEDGEQIARVRCKDTDEIWRGIKPQRAYFLSPVSAPPSRPTSP